MALSREITLTIDNYNITLDKEIKIYEYDAINLCFTIQECGIVMRDGKAHNRVMPVVALKAYMLIETPQGTDSVEATNIVRNKIMFSLGNKYSRFVGTGKMQIILKDFDGCRITLPEFAYEVKQSINTGWDDGSFDVLITEKEDVIITDELGRPVETTKISEFDETDEITPQTYTMVINEDGNKKIKLDTMMESISEMIEFDVEEIDRRIDEMIEVYDDEEVEVEFPSLHNDVERIKGEINEINQSLDKKANKNEVFKKEDGISINDFDESTRRTFLEAQGIDVNYVLGRGNVKIENTSFINIETNNLFDKFSYEKTGYYHRDGSFVVSDSYHSTGFISVPDNIDYLYNNFSGGIVTAYDADKVFLKTLDEVDKYIAINELNIKYINKAFPVSNESDIDNRFIVANTNKVISNNVLSDGILIKKESINDATKQIISENLSNSESKLNGLIWNVLGDSITSTNYANTQYWKLIRDRNGMKRVNNYGIAGSRISKTVDRTDEMSTRFIDMNDEADIITVFGGTNDFASRVPIGSITDSDNTTFYGALNVLCIGLINKYKGKKIGFITPMQRKSVSSLDETWLSYQNAIKEVCGKFSIPVLDLNLSGGLAISQSSIISETFTIDGLHPNDLGHEVISRRIENFITSL